MHLPTLRELAAAEGLRLEVGFYSLAHEWCLSARISRVPHLRHVYGVCHKAERCPSSSTVARAPSASPLTRRMHGISAIFLPPNGGRIEICSTACEYYLMALPFQRRVPCLRRAWGSDARARPLHALRSCGRNGDGEAEARAAHGKVSICV